MTSGTAVRRLSQWSAETLEELARDHDTPLYVLDLDRVEANLERLADAFPDAAIHYAAKANAGRAVLSTLAALNVGVECASAGEVSRALDAGFDQREVLYTPVNPPARDLDAILTHWDRGGGMTVTAGAVDTIERLAQRGYDGRLAIRVHPGVGAGHDEDVSTGADAKFGVPADDVPAAVERAIDEGMDVVGLHAHVGSGLLSDDDIEAHRAVVETLAAVAKSVPVDVEFVDVGGGFGVPYRPEEDPLDLDRIAAAIRESLDEVDARLVVEPGRYLVADAGVLLATVNTIKEPPSGVLAGVDAGMTDLLRPALYNAYHEVRNLAPDVEDREEATVSVVGPICESTDVLASDRRLPHPERGDLLAVGNAGAYGIEMANQYNSRPRAAVVALQDGEERVVRRREDIADITTTEVSR